MVDQNKRRTIKLMSGAGAATIGTVAIGGAVFGASSTAIAGATANTGAAKPHNPLFADMLEIQIITGRSTPEDTVIFVNNSKHKIIVKEFLPRYVTFENHMMDINSICEEEELTIMPNYPVASKLASWEILALTPTSSYLWSDTANMPLNTPHTGVISIQAAVVNGQALLTLDKNLAKVDFS